MKLPNITGLVGVIKTFAMANRPEILLATALTASAGTAVTAAIGGYKAGQRVLECEHPSVDFNTPENPLDVKEKIQLTWLCYMPAAISFTTAVGSISGLHLVHVKDKKAMATAALAALEEVKVEAKAYQEEVLATVKDTVTEKQGEKIDAALEEKGLVLQNTDGEISDMYLIRCPISGRDIWANMNQVEAAIIEVGNCINGSESASLNNFWEQAGWGRLDQGEDLGWNGVLPAVSWNDQFGRPIAGVRDDGRPWRSFRFQPEPEKGFDEYQR